ncbi:hypothetical protein [Telmatospirillum siberiense]|nr:hypothetical protein [Telmatospirillum siberiense]
MRDDGFIDLTGEDKLWRLHRVSAVVLPILVIIHLSLRLPAPVGWLEAAWAPLRDGVEDALLIALALVAAFHVLVGIRHLRLLCPMLWPRAAQRRNFMAWCIAAERYSGLTLAGFLVLHLCLVFAATLFYAELDGLIRRSGGGLVTLAEGFVLMLLVMHGIGGIRVLIQERLNTHRLDRPLGLLAMTCALLTLIAWYLAAGR